MPKVIAPHGCYLVALAANVDAGDEVEVDEATARSLVEQGWRPVEDDKAPSRAAKQPAAEPVEED